MRAHTPRTTWMRTAAAARSPRTRRHLCVVCPAQEVLLFPAMKPIEGGVKVTESAAQVKSEQAAAGTEDKHAH